MKEIHTLLTERWILRKKDPETYYQLKDQNKEYKDFLKQKLGYNMIMNPLLIKLEKVPGKAQSWMGISDFQDPVAYVFLCLVLMFLEEKEPGEQFVLSQVIDYVQQNYRGDLAIDWTNYAQRKHMIRVLRFCMDEDMILKTDGDDTGFTNSQDAVEVLYENTGASKYFMRRFPFDITEARSLADIEHMEWDTDEKDRGLIRRHRVYRRLLMEPVVYEEVDNDQDYLYIKSMRSVLEHDMETYLDARFHLHKNSAVLLLENSHNPECLPNRKNLSDIAFQMCKQIREYVVTGKMQLDFRGRIMLSETAWESIIKDVKLHFGEGWSKAYREMTLTQLKRELETIMRDFDMIRLYKETREVMLMPVIGKFAGDYSEEYWQSKEK